MRNPFGQVARDERVRARKSLKEVAEALEFSIVYISDIERGRRYPPEPEKVREWARVVGADPDSFDWLAHLTRKAVTLTVDNDDAEAMRNRAAFALARRWPHLTEDQLRQIEEITGGNPREKNGE